MVGAVEPIRDMLLVRAWGSAAGLLVDSVLDLGGRCVSPPNSYQASMSSALPH